jgi:hypothetical protein
MKPFLSALKAFVNNKRQWDAFNEMLAYQIEQQQRKLEQSTEMSDVFKAQGAIAVLRQLKYLRDEANVEK